MVHLRIIYALMLLHCCLELVAATKIAYKKPIYGKANFIKDKRYKTKADLSKMPLPTAAPATTTITEVSPTTIADMLVAAKTQDAASYEVTEYNINATPTPMQTTAEVSAESLLSPDAEASVLEMPHNSITTEDAETVTTTTTESAATNDVEVHESEELTTTAVATPVMETTPASNAPMPCTCGVFLSSQIQNGLQDQPLILNELDRMYPCNPIGRKQCQTKCLEAIVQHLPNSANIVCATLGHDCHKERAYLFIKNCQNQWWNTNLQAGREYCCKDGLPYRCPLLG